MAEPLLQALGSQARASSTFDDHGVSAQFRSLSSAQVCALLNMNLQMLVSLGDNLAPTTALRELETGSPFSNLRLHPSASVTGAVAATYVYLFQHTPLPVASEAAACLKREIELLTKHLGGGSGTLGLVDTEVVALLRFDIMVLLVGLIHNTPDFKVRARELVRFILEKLDPFGSPVRRFIELQLSVVQALKRGYSWIVPWETDTGRLTEFLSECGSVMTRGLRLHASLPLKLEILDWLREFPRWFVEPRDVALVSDSTVSALAAAASDKEVKVRQQVARTLETLIHHRCLSPSQVYMLVVAAFHQLADPEPGLQASYYRVVGTYSSALWMHGRLSCGSSTGYKKDWRYLLSVKRFSLHLSPPHVVSILNYVFQRPQLLPAGWLQRLVFSCLKSSSRKGSEDKAEGGGVEINPLEEGERFDLVESWCSGSNTAAAWFVIQELARHCVAVRFRTHLGGPTQTFTTVERMLLDLPQLAQSETQSPAGPQLLPMRLLLELVDSLQKNIYNAYEGSLVLEAAPSSSTHFFRANKKVCEEWYARIREPFVNASSAIECHFGTAQYSVFRLIDLVLRLRSADNVGSKREKLQQDIYRALRHGALALCKMRESDALLGLYAWVVAQFGGSILEDVQKTSSSQGPLGWMVAMAHEARGEFETAAARYMELLQSEEVLAALGADGVRFTIARIVDSYVALSDWDALEKWLQELQALRTKHAGKPFTGALMTASFDMNSIHAWARFDAGDVEGTWSYLDLTPQSNSELIVDPRQALQRSEQMLLQAMLRKDGEQEEAAREIKKARAMLDGPLLVSALDGMPTAAPYLMQLHNINVLESSRGLDDRRQDLCSTAFQVFSQPVDEMYHDCQLWLKTLRVYKRSFPQSEVTSMLQQHLFRLARKHKNFRLARRLLKDMDTEVLTYQNALLLFSEGKHQKAMLELWSLAKVSIADCLQPTGSPDNLTRSRACLKLASWVDTSVLSEMELNNVNIGSSREAAVEVMGAASKAATLLAPSFEQAWFSYASWCYLHARAGAQVISKPRLFPEIIGEELGTGIPSLTDEDVQRVHSLILAAVSEEVSAGLEGSITEMLVKRTSSLMETAAGDAGFETWDGDSPVLQLTLQLRQELQVLKPSTVATLINELLKIWWTLRKKRATLVGHAARGFLKYLSMSSRASPPSKECSVLSALLYVLRILQAYGTELEETLQRGFSSVPPSLWQELTPQLFALISGHPEVGVRKQLEGLLIGLASAYPWAIVYPTLVHLSALEGQSSLELEHILNSLLKLHPKVVNDVRLMIAELGSITFLWEEQWLTTIQELHPDVTRRIATLKEEAARVAENQTLSLEEKTRINAAKYSAVMAPIVLALERRLAVTSKPAETPHEVWFQEHFGVQLRSAIAVFKAHPTGPNLLSNVWKPFDALAASLASHHKRSSVLLKDVSPRLAALKQSEAPMPGLRSDRAFEVVTVANFHEQVTILATKTKPKKVFVTGSDGQVYTYLLKGREDLRLDARIMQLLRASNKMLRSSRATRREGLAVRCYSVTPISGRAGLIQWVDNVTSLYSVYRAWQLRAQATSTPAGGNPTLPRPSDMFYGKLIPALKEKGVRKVYSRREWPLDVKTKVLKELVKETPSQILYRELWCASDGLKGFDGKIKRYTGTVAAMSMIGHVLGLGDRHLDNILIDLSTGDVVHIDYNICFEKGLRLKVPEIVPFRLTQIMQNALGPTVVEGVFRAECEAVMSTLQKNKDVILMLLEAFIWDPLVEWMRGDGHDEATVGGEERKGMELAVSLSLFASHIQENRVALQEHYDELHWTLPSVAATLQAWDSGYEIFEKSSLMAFHVNQRKQHAEKAEAGARDLLAEASSALEKAHLNYELQAHELAQVKGLVVEAARETGQWVEQRSRTLDALRNNRVAELQALANSTEAVSLLQGVQASGVSITVLPEPTQVLCKEVDKEISQYATARQDALLHASITLQAYTLALQKLLPANYYTTSFVHSWSQVLQLVSRQTTPEVLNVAKRQALEIIASGRGEHDEIIRQKHEELLLHIERLNQEVGRLEMDHLHLEESIDPTAERKAKERLMSIFLRSLQLGRRDEDDIKDLLPYEHEERQHRVLTVFQSAAATIYTEIGESLSSLIGSKLQGWCFMGLQGLAERCCLVSDILAELQDLSGRRASITFAEHLSVYLAGVDHLVKQMVGVVLPETVRATLSQDQAVIEAFASLSEIRKTVAATLNNVVEVETQKAILKELEQSYPKRMEETLKRKEFLEAAAADGREDLSWEEAEELATQEESCREQLETLQSAWSQRGAEVARIMRLEALVQSSLANAERRFEELVELDTDDLHLMRGKVLLAAFGNLFSRLESQDLALTYSPSPETETASELEHVWKFSNVLKDKTFFVWKVYVVDALLDSCLRDTSSDLNLSLDQCISQQTRRLDVRLQGLLDVYLRQRVAPAFLDLILKETVGLRAPEYEEDIHTSEAVKKAIKLLREYCDVHETVQAAKSAASALKAETEDTKQRLANAQIEILQMEWLHDTVLSQQAQVAAEAFASEESASIKWWNRKQILENIRNSIAAISRATEGLQKSELASLSAEEKLERTMGWVSGAKGAPQEFREHLRRRKQLLWNGQEQAIAIVRHCVAVLEFEASRDGYFESSKSSSSGDGKAWQQSYESLIARLDAAYISFTSCDFEWKAAENAMESASANLSSMLVELEGVSGESETSGAEIEAGFLELKQLTADASESVSALCKVLKSHSALTSEATMLDEIVAMTETVEGANDVYVLAREAVTERKRLISELKKVHNVVVPMEPLLSTAANEPDFKSAQASLQSLNTKLKDVLSDLPVLATSTLDSARKMHMILLSLGRAAGTLNKVIEGIEETQSMPVGSTEGVLPPEKSLQVIVQRLPQREGFEGDESWISPPGTQSEDSEESDAHSTSTNTQPGSQADNGSVKAESVDSQARSKAGVSQQQADGTFAFTETEKLNSGDPRSGNEQKQHSSKGNSSNVLSFPQSSNFDYQSRVVRGTAVSVLKRVRTKLEGRDIDETGQLSIPERVDYLIRQATSMNNLCNMYEGWTPWI